MKRVKIGGHYWLRERFGVSSLGIIIKIQKLGDETPQQIAGELFNVRTGEISFAGEKLYDEWDESDSNIFAANVNRKVTARELKEEKSKAIERVNNFFTPNN